MSERWTLPVDDDGPTRVSSDQSEDRTLIIGDPAPVRRRRLPGLRQIGAHQWCLLLGILSGAGVGFLAALGLRVHDQDHDVRRGVYPVPCAEADVPATVIPQAADASAPTPGYESPRESFDEGGMARRAADLVVANRYGEALTIYRRLAELRPDEAAFFHLSSVLETKLRCDSAQSLGGVACE